MSRIRSIKPEFWTSGQILECSRNARLAFIGLWNFCDDAGRHDASPERLKAEVFPGDSVSPKTVMRWVQELIDAGLIQSYVVAGQGVWQVTGWHHQRIDRPQPARYPAADSTNDHGTFRTDPIRSDRKGGEGKPLSPSGGGKKRRTQPGSLLEGVDLGPEGEADA